MPVRAELLLGAIVIVIVVSDPSGAIGASVLVAGPLGPPVCCWSWP